METKEISQNTNPLESESIGKLILTHSESIVRILQLGVASGANQLAITLVQINFQSQRYFQRRYLWQLPEYTAHSGIPLRCRKIWPRQRNLQKGGHHRNLYFLCGIPLLPYFPVLHLHCRRSDPVRPVFSGHRRGRDRHHRIPEPAGILPAPPRHPILLNLGHQRRTVGQSHLRRSLRRHGSPSGSQKDAGLVTGYLRITG